MFQLSQELLQLKEDRVEAFESSIDVSQMSSAMREKQLTQIAESIEDDLQAAMLESTAFGDLKAFMASFAALSGSCQAKLFDTVMFGIHTHIETTGKQLAKASTGENLEVLKGVWERLMFLLFWIVGISERQATAKVASVLKTKDKKSAASSDAYDWTQKKIQLLQTLNDTLALPLNRIWTLMHERAPFITIFMEVANVMMETDVNVKSSSPLRKHIANIVAVCVCNYGQSQEFHTTIIQNLRYSTHLAELMADIVHLVLTIKEVPGFLERLLGEIGQCEFEADDKASKEFSKFLLTFAAACPRDCLKNLSLIMELMDCESYTMRSAMIEVIGFVMAKQTQLPAENATITQVSNLCMALEERFLDVSSFCRAKVLKVFLQLCEVVEQNNTDVDSRVKNAIPLSRRLHIVDAAIERLHDKTAMVRKDSIRLLAKLIETHPFWLDGGALDAQLFEQRKQAIQLQLENSIVSDDLIGALKDALPASAKAAMELDNADADNALLVTSKPAGPTLDTEQFEKLQKQLIYYTDALRFTRQLGKAVIIIAELLASKVKTDIVESISFFVEAKRHSFAPAEKGIQKMVHLIWSKDVADNESKSVKECLINSYKELLLDVDAIDDKDLAKKVAKNLITLTFNGTLADLTSTEQLLSTMMSRGYIEDCVVNHLWLIYGCGKVEIPVEQRRGAIIILGMLAKDNADLVQEKISLLTKIGFGQHGCEDMLIARYTCLALQKLGQSRQSKKSSKTDRIRLENGDVLFLRIKRMLVASVKSLEWFQFAEQAIEVIYQLAEQPDLLCSSVIKKLHNHVFFKQAANDLQSENDETPSETFSPQTDSFDLARLVFIVGHVAIKQVVYLETVESELKRRDAGKSKSAAKSDELDQIVGSVEDDVADQIHFVRNVELLTFDTSLLTVYAPMVTHICRNNIQFKNPLMLRMAILSLCKFMCVSERFAEDNLPLLLSILEKSSDISSRSNVIVGLGDLAVCFTNLIDQNISYLYSRLRDSNREVKKNALMVLTHLILNGMVKVKGQISEMAVCLEDTDERISDLATLFFTELATKENAIYNNLPDIISGLSQREDALSEISYRNIMKFLLSFIEKDKQNESIIEKLCIRFKQTSSHRLWRDIAYSLSMLQYKSERGIKKLVESIPLYQDKLFEESVFKYFMDIVTKARKTLKADNKSILDDYESMLIKCQESSRVNADAVQNASQASKAYTDWENLPPAEAIDRASTQLQNFNITTPVKKSKTKPKRMPARKVVVESDDDDEEHESNEEFKPSTPATKSRSTRSRLKQSRV
eukprot:Partr_v1_DN28930_c0_g1_i5_m25543 putative Regulatory subunit of the condensin complex, a complex required for conversion of interphase chromatin into mitotic-like condense chromosomes. The condensin complex probably introduces positive supercoils into relaxed DNA in the presence of type I topoisomerases and converts nicked DNA into positive knotted forms in the presence of type II topoisomerases (By similarity)